MGRLLVLEAVTTMVGCIIGAGIFGIPYVVAQAGFLTGLLNLVVIGVFVLITYLYLGEIVLRTNGRHQLTGYAERYLGRWGKLAMAFSMVFGIYGALTAYIIGEGSAISSVLGGSPLVYSLLFFAAAAYITYHGLETLEKSELLTMFLIFIIVFVIIIFTSPHINTSNLTEFNAKKLFVPYGVVLFSYLGMIAVPEVREILEHDKKKIKKTLFIGMAIPAVIYLLFTLVVVGSVGIENFNSLSPNERLATIALGKVISPKLFIIVNVFAVFAMFTSFIAVGYALKEMFMYDYHLKKKPAWALTCFVPLGIALLNLTNFIQALNIVGIVAGGIDAALIVLMFHRAKKHGDREPEYTIKENWFLSFLIMVLFISGVVALLI